MKEILLLGGTGFIGQALARALLVRDKSCKLRIIGRNPAKLADGLACNPRVSVQRADLGPDTNFLEFVGSSNIVIHLLSSSVPIDSGTDYRAELQDISVTAELLEACVAAKVERFVYVSSAGSVYGDTMERAADEDTPCAPVSLYAYQKRAIEELIEFFGRTKGLDYCIARVSNPFGPGQDPTRNQGAIAIFMANVMRGAALTVRGDGSSTRDYIYIDDAAKAIAVLALEKTRHRIYNVASGVSTPLADVIGMIERAVGTEAVVEHINPSEADVGRLELDVSRYEEEFGKLASVGLPEGIGALHDCAVGRCAGLDSEG